VFKLRAWFLVTFQVRRCRIKIDSAVNLGKKAELGVRAVCAVGDTTDVDCWVDLLCCSLHCDTAESCLTNDTLTTFSSSSGCYDDWRRPSPTVRRLSYDATPAVRFVGVVYYAVCQRANRLQLAATYICLVTFLVLYYVIVSCFPIASLSISLDTVLSHNYCITPVIQAIFWFQSCLLIIPRFPPRLTAE